MTLRQIALQMKRYAKQHPCKCRQGSGVTPDHTRRIDVDGRPLLVTFTVWNDPMLLESIYMLTLSESRRYRPNQSAVAKLVKVFFDARLSRAEPPPRLRGDFGYMPNVVVFQQRARNT